GKAVVMGNGLPGDAFVAPGARTVAIYDPSSNAWTLGAQPVATMTAYAPAILPSGEVALLGGGTGYLVESPLPSMLRYDAVADDWSTSTVVPDAHLHAPSAVILASGNVLIVGGQPFSEPGTGGTAAGTSGATSSADVYEPAVDDWIRAPAMSTARRQAATSGLLDGRVLVTGGYLTAGYLSSAEIFSEGTLKP